MNFLNLLHVIFLNLSFHVKSCFLCWNFYYRPISETTTTPRGAKLTVRLNGSKNLLHKLVLSLRSWVLTLKISSLITFLKKPLLNQRWPYESDLSTVWHPKAKPSQPLEARPSSNQQSTAYWGHRLFLTARAFRWCPTIATTRRSTPSDAPRDERANEETTVPIWS